jgi:hypothetical protein
MRKGRLLFTTHEPPFRAGDSAVGRIIPHEGRFYQITAWVELRPVPLERGGSVGEWAIWGRRVSKRRLRREVVGAAEAILGERLPSDGG